MTVTLGLSVGEPQPDPAVLGAAQTQLINDSAQGLRASTTVGEQRTSRFEGRRRHGTFGACAGTLIEKVIDRHDRLGALIDNAGQGCVGLLTDLDADAIGDLVEVELTAIADLTRFAPPHLHRRGGDVVMVSSAAGLAPVPPRR
jgi:NAD(P)-dependent dehydrogenase (short-subunit alcohol dehydrogenase family)